MHKTSQKTNVAPGASGDDCLMWPQELLVMIVVHIQMHKGLPTVLLYMAKHYGDRFLKKISKSAVS